MQDYRNLAVELISTIKKQGADAADVFIVSSSGFNISVRLGNVETAVAGRTDTEIEKLIRRSLKEVGQVQEAELTVFTDSCPELRSIVVDAGVTTPPPS